MDTRFVILMLIAATTLACGATSGDTGDAGCETEECLGWGFKVTYTAADSCLMLWAEDGQASFGDGCELVPCAVLAPHESVDIFAPGFLLIHEEVIPCDARISCP